MWLVSCLASRGPGDEQEDTVDHSNALEAALSIYFSDIFTGQKIAVKERLQVGKVDSVVIEIDLPLGFVPGDHTS